MSPCKIEYYKAENEANKIIFGRCNNSVDFLNTFHNFIYILKGVWAISPGELKNELSNSFFSEIVKMIREVKMHTGDDFIRVRKTVIPGMQFGQNFGIINNGSMTICDVSLPRGRIEFSKEFVTLNGKPIDLGIPVGRYFCFREINESDSYEKNYKKFKMEFSKHNPYSFVVDCINYYYQKLMN